MRAAAILRIGLFGLLAAIVLPVLNTMVHLAEKDRLDSWSGWLFRGAGVVLGLAVVVWVLEKAGMRVSGARCKVCRRRVEYGRSLCHDHLRAQADTARAEHHGRRGMGV